MLQNVVESLIGVSKLRSVYAQVQKKSTDERSFLDATLAEIGVEASYSKLDIEKIPSEGPVVVIANHPYGGIEGVMLGKILLERRPDIRLLGNPILEHFKEIKNLFFFVRPYQDQEALKVNVGPTRQAFKWLKRDKGLLALFPSGEVSHRTWSSSRVCDPVWDDSFLKMIQSAEAKVVPVFFEGKNGFWFNLIGLLNPKLRTLLLPGEIVNKKGTCISIQVGNAIPSGKLMPTVKENLNYLRFRTYALENRVKKISTKSQDDLSVLVNDKDALSREINNLPPEQSLCSMKKYIVKYAHYKQIPLLMDHIGRMREQTFRLEGEGTGKEIDIDAFDEHYLQLFVWNEEEQELVGAYRIGQVDLILKEKGIAGLYSHSLFHYAKDLLPVLECGLEMGRSFVTPKYQRNYISLMLLWKGIGALVGKMPRYRRLFGPVSISNHYSNFSKTLMVDCLRRNHFRNDLAKWVHSPNPWKQKIHLEEYKEINLSLEQVSEVVADIEKYFQGVPVLLKHYLRLGGEFLGFNVDPDFNDALDGFIMVDLDRTQEKVLKSYMGDSYLSFLEYGRANLK